MKSILTPELGCSVADVLKRNGFTDAAVVAVFRAVNSYEKDQETISNLIGNLRMAVNVLKLDREDEITKGLEAAIAKAEGRK